MTKPFFEDEYAVIEFDETIPCVKVTLRGVPRGSDHYQLVQAKRLELMAQEIRNYPKLHMLTDSTSAGPVLDEDIMHFRDQVMPAMVKAGVRFLAIVVPTNKFTQLTIREMTQEADIMKVRYFETLRDAKQWLRRMTVL